MFVRCHFADYVSWWMGVIVVLPTLWATGVTVVFHIVSLILRIAEKGNTKCECNYLLNIYISSG